MSSLKHQEKRVVRGIILGLVVMIVSLTSVTAMTSPAQASAPILLNGSAWLNSQGVNVCAPSTDPYCGDEYKVGGVSSNWWQCVELAQRLYNKMGWHSGTFGVWYAYQIYDEASSMGMSRQANGSITSIHPGDMVIHGSDEPYSEGAGHVTIVDRVEGSTVHVVEQNTANNDPTGQYTLSGGTLSRSGSGTIRGTVHDPANNLESASNSYGDDIAWWQGSTLFAFTGSNFLTSSYTTGLNPGDWQGVMDYNHDGRDDIVLYRASDQTLRVILKNTSGGFSGYSQNPVRTGVGSPTWAGVADLDGDNN